MSSRDVVGGLRARGCRAEAFDDRAACGDRLVALARPGDRIVIMGARDDTLSLFAASLMGWTPSWWIGVLDLALLMSLAAWRRKTSLADWLRLPPEM